MRRLLLLAIVLALAVAPPPDDLDAFVWDQMSQREITGLSLAINANDNSPTMNRIVDFVAGKYKWPPRPSSAPPAKK